MGTTKILTEVTKTDSNAKKKNRLAPSYSDGHFEPIVRKIKFPN